MKDFYCYALHKAHEELAIAVNESIQAPNEKPELEGVHYRMISLLHWSLDCWNRIYHFRDQSGNALAFDTSDYDFMQGFRRINNIIKHKKSFVIIHRRIQGFRFPLNLAEPYRFGSAEILWKDIPHQPDEKTDSNTMKAIGSYSQHLSNKSLLPTCDQMVMIIDKYIACMP